MAQTLLHISDLHIGADHGFLLPGQNRMPGHIETDIADAINEDLNRLDVRDIVGIIISGDITTYGRWVDHGENAFNILEKLCNLVHVQREHVFIVPGNHDYEWYTETNNQWERKALAAGAATEEALHFGHVVQFENFRKQFYGDSYYRIPCVRKLDLAEYTLKIGLLDSCRITATRFHEYGYLSAGQIKSVNGELNQVSCAREVRALVLHHHLTSVIPAEPPPNEAGVSVTLDAARLLDASLPSGISFILHGHQHYPCVSRVNKSHPRNGAMDGLAPHDVYLLSAGSVGVRRERLLPQVTNTYALIGLGATDATVRVRSIFSSGAEGRTYLETRFPLIIHQH